MNKRKKMPLNIQLFAEEKEEPVTQTEENIEEPVTQTENKTEDDSQTKTFTQEEVNAMLRKERKRIPNKEEMKAFNDWKESQKSEEDKKTELTQENMTLKQEKENLEQLLTIIDKGIIKDEAEFIQFKVGKMEGDFEDNLEEFLKKNPKYLVQHEEQEEQEEQNINLGGNHNTNYKNVDPSKMDYEEYKKWRKEN